MRATRTPVQLDKGEAPLNIALIELDEGFRMMSRVEGIDAMDVKIGIRVTRQTTLMRIKCGEGSVIESTAV